MRKCIARIVAIVAVLAWAADLQAQPAYSFETVNGAGPDGFFGLGAAVTQDTIGATHGANSMKYVTSSAGFVGARTETVIPAGLNDPPGVTHILFDMTLIEPFAGAAADIGVTIFGHALNAVPAEFGHQVQFADTEPIAGKAAGTYLNLQINLNQSLGPYRVGESFNQIFGPGAADLTQASAFQFFISKTVGPTATVYIDNVRLVPEPAAMGLLGITLVALRRCRRGM